MPATVLQLNISPGGMPKHPIPKATITVNGLSNDWQKNRKYHGGPNRAICLYSQELYDWLRTTHNINLPPGSVGENITTTGLDLQSLNPGDILQIGNSLIELTEIRVPCRNLNHLHPHLLEAIQGHSGWLAKVQKEAEVQPGDQIIPIPRLFPPIPSPGTPAEG